MLKFLKIYTNKVLRLFSSNYYFAILNTYLSFYLYSRNKQFLLVYQMGKVGSTTIVESLKVLKIKFAIFHVHILTKEGIAFEKKSYYGKSNGLILRSLLPQTAHLFASYYLLRIIDRGLNNRKWKIVTLVREPIARNISAFFETIELRIPNFYRKYRENLINTKEVTEFFLKHFDDKFESHELPLRWFDTELKQVFNIDVFSSDFPKSEGFRIYRGEWADVLLLKLESINKIVNKAFKEFLNLEGFTLITDNAAKKKYYYPIYREFIKNIVLPNSYIDEMYSSKYVKHFYSEEEINKFKSKWQKKTV